MKQLFILIFLLLAPFYAGAILNLELEHSFAHAEGSSWGIEGELRRKLEIAEEILPSLYKMPLTRPQPQSLSLAHEPLAQHFFIKDNVFLYSSLNLCIDRRLDIQREGFDQALNNFLKKTTQYNVEGHMLSARILRTDFENPEKAQLRDCDVYLLKGSERDFPFSQVKTSPRPNQSGLPQMILGLYFRLSENTVPVVVFNPSLHLDFSADQEEYMRVDATGRVNADGRTLLFHELGHVLGLSHIKDQGTWRPFSQFTVMGLDTSQESSETASLRYRANYDIWDNWDIRQTSLYRALFSRWIQGEVFRDQEAFFSSSVSFQGYCVLPGEDLRIAFTPLRVTGLSEVKRSQDGSDQRDHFILPDLGQKISQAPSLRTRYQIFPKETFEKIEVSNSSGSAYFENQNLERYTFRDHDSGLDEDWLLLSLRGRISFDSSFEFGLSGTYFIDRMTKLFFPLMRFQVESDQRRCYRK